jgi:hypothetical protein
MKKIIKKVPALLRIVRNTRDLTKLIAIGFFPLRMDATLARHNLEFRDWGLKDYTSPSPHYIKQSVIKRNCINGSLFVETGTYFGATTKFASTFSPKVITIEPDFKLYKLALDKFFFVNNVEIINGTSESVFPELIPKLSGDVSFWLDGHYSGGVTFKSHQDTPILSELEIIEKHLKNLSRVSIMIDDFRCFNPSNPQFRDYPSKNFLVDWATRNNLKWTVEHDIFIAQRH